MDSNHSSDWLSSNVCYGLGQVNINRKLIRGKSHITNFAYYSQSSQSAQYCFKFYVSTENLCVCPGESCTTTITS